MQRFKPAIAIGHTPSRFVSAQIGWRAPLLAVTLLLGIMGRIGYSWNAPLWFDEGFSAVIATQLDFASLLRWCLTELTGPAFYMPLWIWVKLVGSSDFALRLPSLVLSLVGPLLILWKGSADREIRFWWTIFALLWVPMFVLAGKARPYPQMFVLGTLQAIAFVALLETPTTARATKWIALSVLLILTHYAAAVPCIVQGLAYLAYHRFRAVRTWPAALLLVPLAAWASVHLPMVFAITFAPDSPYSGMPISAALYIPAMLLGINLTATIILAVIAGSIALLGLRRKPRVTPELVLALCGVASVVLLLVFGFTQAWFAPRYMMPTIPSLLFGFALWARWMAERDARPLLVVMAMMLSTASGAVWSILTEPGGDVRHLFNLQRPSAWLAEKRPTRLVMFWDGPTGALTSDEHLDQVGGFFLRREGAPLSVRIARAGTHDDPNRAVLDLAQANSAILWTANNKLPDSRAPRIERYDRRYECRDFGAGQLTMTACRPR